MHGRTEKLLTTADLAERPAFRLGEAIVQPSTRTVTGPGGSDQIEPRMMQVLVVLADAGGAVVTRDTLLQRCWGDVYVGDDSLNRAIAGVRRIAAGVANGTVTVETIPRVGYRLVADPNEAASLPPGSPAADESTPAGTSRITRRWLLAGGLAAAAGGTAFWAGRRTPPDPAAPLIEQSRIAMRAGMPESSRRAIALLERAVAVSPNNAAAWGLLALTLARVDEHVVGSPTSPAEKVDRAAHRALELDPGNADAKAALAVAIPYFGDWLAAERRFDAVLAEHPDHLFTQDSRAFFLGTVGRMRESALARAALSPEASLDADLEYRRVYCHWFLGQIAEADRVGSRGLQMWPGHAGLWFARLWVLAGTGRLDRAIAHIADPAGRPPLPPPMISTLHNAMAAAASRQPGQVDAAVRQIMAGVGLSVAAVINAVMLLNLLRATDAVFDLAEAYYLERGPIIAAMQWRPGQPSVPDQRRRKTNMLFTPIAAPMQRDPRFLPLMEAIGLQAYWDRRRVLPDFLATAPR